MPRNDLKGSLSRGIFGAFALLADVQRGAVCLRPRSRGCISPFGLNQFPRNLRTAINRAAKADRAGPSDPRGRPGRFRFGSMVFPIRRYWFACRWPGKRAPRPSSFVQAGRRKMAVACEPVVSVLTEIAKRLAARPLRDLKLNARRDRTGVALPDRRTCCQNYSAGALSSLDGPRLARNPNANPPTARIGISLLMPMARIIWMPVGNQHRIGQRGLQPGFRGLLRAGLDCRLRTM